MEWTYYGLTISFGPYRLLMPYATLFLIVFTFVFPRIDDTDFCVLY